MNLRKFVRQNSAAPAVKLEFFLKKRFDLKAYHFKTHAHKRVCVYAV